MAKSIDNIELKIIELSTKYVKWKITGLDPNYSRNDRIVQFTVIKPRTIGKGPEIIHQEVQSNAYDLILNLDDSLIRLPPKIKETEEFVTHFNRVILELEPEDENKQNNRIIFQTQVFYSWGPLAETDFEITSSSKSKLAANFRNKPNFTIGGYVDKENPTENIGFFNPLDKSSLEDKFKQALKNLHKTILGFKTNARARGEDEDSNFTYFKELVIRTISDKIVKKELPMFEFFPCLDCLTMWKTNFTWYDLLNNYKCLYEKDQVEAFITSTQDYDNNSNKESTTSGSVDKVVDTNTSTTENTSSNTQQPNNQFDIHITTTPTVSYDENFLKPITSEIIQASGSTQYKALFPPIVENYQPAFVGHTASEYEIQFKLSEYTNFDEVAHVDVRIVLQSNNTSVVNSVFWVDNIIYKIKSKNDIINYGNGIYGIKIKTSLGSSGNYDLAPGHWAANTYYKVQLRLGTSWTGWNTPEEYVSWRNLQASQGKFSDWSTVMVLKSIKQPSVAILNNQEFEKRLDSIDMLAELNTSPLFYGEYKLNESNELPEIYQFVLQDEATNKILEYSPWLNFKLNEQNTQQVTVNYRFNNELIKDKKYRVIFQVKTENEYQIADDYTFICYPSYLNLDETFSNANFKLLPIKEEDDGVIKLYLQPQHLEGKFLLEDLTGNFVITRKEQGSLEWYDLNIIQTFQGKNQVNSEEIKAIEGISSLLIYEDFTPASGIKYEYGVQRLNIKNQRTERIKSSLVSVDFEHMFLYANGQSLKLKYNPSVDSFKYTVLESKQDTLGGKYPHFSRNGYVYYAEFPFKALISFNSDENGYFSKKFKIKEDLIEGHTYNRIKEGKQEIIVTNEKNNFKNFSTDLSYDNIYKEKDFREEVEKFLNNGEAKLFRSSTEGNFIVRLMEINFSPEAQLGRMIYSVSGKAYEVAECNINNLKKYGILNNNSFSFVYGTEEFHGQLAGRFNSSVNLMTEIRNQVLAQDPKITYTQYEFGKLKEFKIEPYPKINLDNYINYLYAQDDSSKRENVEQLQRALTTYNDYVPMDISINGTILTLLPDTPYVLTNCKYTIGDNLHMIKVRDKNNNELEDFYQPILFDYFADINIQEGTGNIISGSYIQKGYAQTYGYFNKEGTSPYIANNELISTQEFNGLGFFNSLDIMAIIKEQIRQKLLKEYNLLDRESQISWNIENKIQLGDNFYVSLIDLTNIIIETSLPALVQKDTERFLVDSNGTTIEQIGVNSIFKFLDSTEYEGKDKVLGSIIYDYTLAFVEYEKGGAE